MTTESHDFIQRFFDASVQFFLSPIRLFILLLGYIISAIFSWAESVIRDCKRYSVLHSLLDRIDLVSRLISRLTEENLRLTHDVDQLRIQNAKLRQK